MEFRMVEDGVAQEVLVRLVDDLEPPMEADETLQFTVDGITYEIDLAAKNADAFRTAVGPFIDAARRIAGRKTSRRLKTATGEIHAPGPEHPGVVTAMDLTRAQRDAVRQWGPNNGYTMSERGRIAAEIVIAWQRAGSPPASQPS